MASYVIKTNYFSETDRATVCERPYFEGSEVSSGDEVFIWFSKGGSISGLAWTGSVESAEQSGAKLIISVALQSRSQLRLGVEDLRPHLSGPDEAATAELATKLHTHSLNKVAKLSLDTTEFLRLYFSDTPLDAKMQRAQADAKPIRDPASRVQTQLRRLDQRVERIELALRAEIVNSLNGDAALLPQGLLQKIRERIGQSLRKNAALRAEQFRTMDRQIEYFDLRDVQEVICSRGLWPRFETRFANKEFVLIKFDQLAEFRNCLRHSRTLNDITRKEGEASVLWFEEVLFKKK